MYLRLHYPLHPLLLLIMLSCGNQESKEIKEQQKKNITKNYSYEI